MIPLPGHRVALVVGEVVGHGLHAAATMGRLRTAVQNFSALDLPPEELLAHLDDLVTRLDRSRRPTRTATRITGATCLYADLRPGVAVAARWPGPAIRRPRWSRPTAPWTSPRCRPARRWAWAGCPSRRPTPLAEGTRLVLYTDGLVESHDGAPDTGPRPAAQGPRPRLDRGPEEICESLLDTVLPARPSDDVALLVARTPCSPDFERGASGRCRSIRRRWPGSAPRAPRRLRAWGLEEADLRHRADPQRAGHQRDPLRRPSRPPTAAPRPQPDLRGLRRQQHLARTCAGPGPPTKAGAACSWSPSSPSAGAPAIPLRARSSGPSSP